MSAIINLPCAEKINWVSIVSEIKNKPPKYIYYLYNYTDYITEFFKIYLGQYFPLYATYKIDLKELNDKENIIGKAKLIYDNNKYSVQCEVLDDYKNSDTIRYVVDIIPKYIYIDHTIALGIYGFLLYQIQTITTEIYDIIIHNI